MKKMAQIKKETKQAIKKTLLKVAFYFGLVTGVLNGKAPSMESAGNAYSALFPDEMNPIVTPVKVVAPAKA